MKAFAKALEAALEVEVGVDHLSPAAERLAMLDLFAGPQVSRIAEALVVAEDVGEIGGVVTAVVFDQTGGFNQEENIRIDFRGVEATPVDTINRPILFLCGH